MIVCGEWDGDMSGTIRGVDLDGRDAGAAEDPWDLVCDVVLYADDGGRVVGVTPSVSNSLGHRPSELVGRPLVDLLHPDSRVTVEAYLSQPGLAVSADPARVRVRRSDGSWVPTVTRFVRPNGDPAGLTLVVRPVEGSVDVALERERQALERLQLVDEMKHRLLEAVSHELRTPLTIIGGFAETLQREGLRFDTARLREVGESVGRHALRLQRIVSDLMDLDRVSRGALVDRREPADLSTAIIEVVEQVALGARQLHLQLDPVTVPVDRAKFDRIVENLLVNVRRHTPEGTTVWVRLAVEDGGAVLEVADDGPGLSDELKAQVFSPFAQGRLLDPSSPGFGLGLALVHRFTQMHGGTCSVQDRGGGGALFRVFLPSDGDAGPDLEEINTKLEAARAHEQAISGRDDGVRLRPDAFGVVTSLLRTVRREMDMRVAFLSAFTGTEHIVLAMDGDGEPVGVRPGGTTPIEDTLCVRMIRGDVGNLIVDTAAEPAVAELPATRAGMACYAGVPVHLPNGQVFGTLCCADDGTRDDLTPAELSVLRTIAGVMGDQLGREQLLEVDDREKIARIEGLLSRPDALRTVYQPIVRIDAGRVAGAEALTRFPDSQIRPPDVWFADAGEVGLASHLEQLTVMRAVRGLEQLPDDCYLSINLSPATVLAGGLRPLLGRIPAERIVVEITEHAAVSDYAALETGLRPFRDAGMRLAIDDVGSGFASLRHVLRLSPDIIKIDRSLVHQVTSDVAQLAIATALSHLGHRIGASIVAEGVEDRATLQELRVAGITHAQGWLFDRPGPLPLPRTTYPTEPEDG